MREEERGDHSPASVYCPVQQAPCGPSASVDLIPTCLISDREILVQGGWARSQCFPPFSEATAVRTCLPVNQVSGQQPCRMAEKMAL